ncbi:MAG: sigma-54 dependent transcriptional regulator [Syntrophales bacterium]|nr:sigma-54 dependent transcriptional regulator [Syntrophales bacterium]
MAKILIVDDDRIFCESLNYKIRDMGHDAVCAYGLKDAIKIMKKDEFDVVYLDVRLPDGNGLSRIGEIKNSVSAPEVIIMTGQGDPDGAELAIKNGAWDYIQKPSSLNKMILPLVRALEYREMKMARKAPPVALRREDIIGNSPPMRVCLDQIAKASVSDLTVLITGETGTGKELVAWAIHQNSARADHDFVVVDCAALSETLVESSLFGHEKGAFTGADRSHTGLIKQADGGTLFLDEVGELPFAMQKSFLRVLQTRRFRPLGSKREITSDFRVVAATNRDLDKMTAVGHFRSDLLYRLQSFHLPIPPLRERTEDIEAILMFHMDKICRNYGVGSKLLSPEFLECLKSYPWPGNVRELVNAMEMSLASAKYDNMLFLKHLPTAIRVHVAREKVRSGSVDGMGEPPVEVTNQARWKDYRDEAIAVIARKYLGDLMVEVGDNIGEACKISGLSRSRLYDLLKKYHD